MNHFTTHARKIVDRRIKEFTPCDPDEIKDYVEEIAKDVANQLFREGVYYDCSRFKHDAGEVYSEAEFDEALVDELNAIFRALVLNPRILVMAIQTATDDHRYVLEKLHNVVQAAFGLYCGDLAADRFIAERKDKA